VRRSRAIEHLVEMAEVATARLDLRDSAMGWPLEELWVSGELLGLSDSVEAGWVVLVLDLPADELPWMARNPNGEWVGEQLRLGKRPMLWCYRPLAWPAWDHEHQRVARVWSADCSLDEGAIDALRTRRLDRLEVVAPSRDELVAQVRLELAVSRTHLRSVLDRYWDEKWRRQHSGYGGPPEAHLWRAASAVADMAAVLDEA
jgi:hypothetical protein